MSRLARPAFSSFTFSSAAFSSFPSLLHLLLFLLLLPLLFLLLTLTLPPHLLSVCSTLGTIRLWHAPEIVAEAEHHGVLVAPSAMDKAMSSAARQQSKAYGEIHRYLDQNLSIYIDPGLPCASHKPVCLPAHAPLSHVNPPPMCSRGAGRAVPGRQYRRRLPTGIPAGQRRRWRL